MFRAREGIRRRQSEVDGAKVEEMFSGFECEMGCCRAAATAGDCGLSARQVRISGASDRVRRCQPA